MSRRPPLRPRVVGGGHPLSGLGYARCPECLGGRGWRLAGARVTGLLAAAGPAPADGGGRRQRLAHGDRVRLTRARYEALRRETHVFTDAFAMLPDIDTRIEGRMMSSTLVTGNFFEVLGVRAARGRTLSQADDERASAQPVVV